MKNLTRVLVFSLCAMVLMSASECQPKNSNTADAVQSKKTEQSLAEMQKEVGMPAIINFQERKTFKWILEMRDKENLITYTYLTNEMDGTIGQFLGKSIGFGIPASTQFTSPQKLVDVTKYGISSYQANDAAVVPQADPNGLFMPTSSDATYVLLLDSKGDPHPVYIEAHIIVSPFKLH